MIDLLKMIITGDLSIDQAYDILLMTNEKFHKGIITNAWNKELGFSDYETAAYLQGASLGDIVKVRCYGWPKICCQCKKPINYSEFGWVIKHKNGALCLEHIACPIN